MKRHGSRRGQILAACSGLGLGLGLAGGYFLGWLLGISIACFVLGAAFFFMGVLSQK